MREELLQRLSEERAAYDRLRAAGLSLARKAVEATPGQEEGELFVEGMANLLDEPAFADPQRMRAILTTLEEKSRLVDLLGRVLEGEGVQVVIGSENPLPDLADCSLVTSTYGAGDRVLGTVGVVGPTRMEYARTVALVAHLSKVLTRCCRARDRGRMNASPALPSRRSRRRQIGSWRSWGRDEAPAAEESSRGRVDDGRRRPDASRSRRAPPSRTPDVRSGSVPALSADFENLKKRVSATRASTAARHESLWGLLPCRQLRAGLARGWGGDLRRRAISTSSLDELRWKACGRWRRWQIFDPSGTRRGHHRDSGFARTRCVELSGRFSGIGCCAPWCACRPTREGAARPSRSIES